MNSLILITATALCIPWGATAFGADLYDPANQHAPKDGVVKPYGAGGPYTALWKVANVWEAKTGKRVEMIADPEAKLFLDFLVTPVAQSLMQTEGWVR